ncbi:MAG: class I SAM-dependent methyltransferase family protein [archaeon]
MLCIKVLLKEAEKAKKHIMREGLIDHSRISAKDKEFIYFPVTKKFKTEYSFVQKKLKEKELRQDLKTSLSEKLSKKDMESLKTSMDVTGSIAIIEVPDELSKKESLIAKELMKANRQITTVLKKGKHEGVFRTQKLVHIGGEDTKETTYKENNVNLKLDVEKVYFSPRLSHERKRIAQLIKTPEDVLVMFSGCAPYVCVIAKNTPAHHVDGVEINPDGHRYAEQNLIINKLKNASVFVGDAREVVPKLGKKYDRILMPLPKSAADYLDVALDAAKKGSIIHFYDFQNEGEFDNSVEKIAAACKKAGKSCEVLDIVRCGQNAPRQHRICVDFRVE